MGKEAVQRRDVTRDPQAESRLVQAPELRDALATLGFGRVGLVESRVPSTVKPEQLKSFIAGPDADLLVRATEEGEVDEVLTSPDRRAFGTAENFFGGPVVCLRTILDSGVVIERLYDQCEAHKWGRPFQACRHSDRETWWGN